MNHPSQWKLPPQYTDHSMTFDEFMAMAERAIKTFQTVCKMDGWQQDALLYLMAKEFLEREDDDS